MLKELWSNLVELFKFCAIVYCVVFGLALFLDLSSDNWRYTSNVVEFTQEAFKWLKELI